MPRLIKTLFLLALSAVLLSGCAHRSPDDQFLSLVFAALKEKDWDDYSRLLVTKADFDLKRQKLSPFKSKQGYVGGVKKPEYRRMQMLQFERATAGGANQIDFAKGEYVGLGKRVDYGLELLSGGRIEARVYSIRYKVDGVEKVTDDEDPLFVVTSWGEKPRLLKLSFKGEKDF